MADSNLNIMSSTPDNLLSDAPRCQPVKVSAGDYKRGEVLGRVGNLYGKISVAESKPAAIMPFEITLPADTMLTVYVGGDFNEDALILEGNDLESVKTALRDVGIVARKWGVAPNVA